MVDAGSQNGTFRNGRRVRSAPVRPGDVVVVGSTRIIFESDEVPAQVPRKTGPEAKRAASPDPDTVTGVGTDGLGNGCSEWPR